MKLFANFFLENPGVNNSIVTPILNMQVFRKFFADLPSPIQEKKGGCSCFKHKIFKHSRVICTFSYFKLRHHVVKYDHLQTVRDISRHYYLLI